MTLPPDKGIDFGLFFFASSDDNSPDRYAVLLEAAAFADEHEFSFVSVPERHFHRFGGLFPNPALLAAAVATTTKRIQIRACSLVSPLHHTLRIVEDWSVVDNLSNGRIAVSFGSGWNINDFILAPSVFEGRREVMWRQVLEVQGIWKSGSLECTAPSGEVVTVHVYPRPVQNELPIWITSSGNEDTFERAGTIGANVLTHLENQDLADLACKILTYRNARATHGYDPNAGKVSLMQHTYILESSEDRDFADSALRRYIASAMDLEKMAAISGGKLSGGRSLAKCDLLNPMIEVDIIDHAVRKYQDAFSLIGSLDECRQRIADIRAIGIDEIACLVDFIDDPSRLRQGLNRLAVLKHEYCELRIKERCDAELRRFLT